MLETNNIVKNVLKIILVICIFLCIALTNGKNRNVSFGENVLSSIIYFPQRGINYLSKSVSNDEEFFAEVEALKTENQELKKQVKDLKNEMADYNLVFQENKRYKLDRDTSTLYGDYEVIIADVIGQSTNNWDEIFIINKGSDDGVKPNMIVITKEGLVGYVSTCTNDTSKVVSIIDATTSISARASETREEVLIKGSNLLKDREYVAISSIPIDVKYISGDEFETSGMGGIYPKGIKIGKVVEFIEKDNPLENEAYVETFVDFNRLETVAILVSN